MMPLKDRWQDSTGTPIKVGSRVAYNMSGDVVPGVVVKLTNSAIHIRPQEKHHQRVWHYGRKDRRGHYTYDRVSKAKAGRRLLVLDQYAIGSWYLPEEE